MNLFHVILAIAGVVFAIAFIAGYIRTKSVGAALSGAVGTFKDAASAVTGSKPAAAPVSVSDAGTGPTSKIPAGNAVGTPVAAASPAGGLKLVTGAPNKVPLTNIGAMNLGFRR